MKTKVKKNDMVRFKTNMKQGQKITIILTIMACISLIFQSCKQDESTGKTNEHSHPWKLICIGDGMTAGVGLDPNFAFPALLKGDYLEKGDSMVKIVNAGIKGETIKGIDQRIEWMLQQRFDAILLTLRSKELTEKTVMNWKNCFHKIRETNPHATILVGVISQTYTMEQLEAFFNSLAKEYDIKLIDLQLFTDNKNMNWWQSGGLYPTKEGQRELATKLLRALQ